MKKGEVWWAELPPPGGRRPVVLLSRDEAYRVRELITIAPVTKKIRDIPTEVRLGRKEGLPKICVANLDTIITIPKKNLLERITSLSSDKIKQIDQAIHFALNLS